MLIETGRDALMSGGFVVPAAGVGIGLQGDDVVELRTDRRGGRWVGDEEVALFADVGVGARPSGFGAGAEAMCESGFEHLGVQPGDLVDRGLAFDDGLLVVLDGAKALSAAVREVFGAKALIQRCTLHKRRINRPSRPGSSRRVGRVMAA